MLPEIKPLLYICHTQFNDCLYFTGDSSLGQRGHGQVLDDKFFHDDLPFLYETVETSSLSKAFNETVLMKKPINQTFVQVILRLNLASKTCKIFTEDNEIFTFGPKSGYAIPYIFMSWNFLKFDPFRRQKRLSSSKCSEEKLHQMITFLTEVSGYTAFDVETRQNLLTHDLLGPKFSWTGHQVMWIHHSVKKQERDRILLKEISLEDGVQFQRDRNTLVHFYHHAMKYKIFPLELRGDTLIIRKKEFRVYEDKSVRSSIDEEPLTEESFRKMFLSKKGTIL